MFEISMVNYSVVGPSFYLPRSFPAVNVDEYLNSLYWHLQRKEVSQTFMALWTGTRRGSFTNVL